MRGRSLRARLVLVGVLPLLVAAIVVVALAGRAFDDFSAQRDREAVTALENQSRGLSRLYARQIIARLERGDRPPRLSKELRTATGSDIYFLEHDRVLRVGATGLDPLPALDVDWTQLDAGETVVLEDLRVPGSDERYLAAVTGIFVTESLGPEEGIGSVGALVVARPAGEITPLQEQLRRRISTAFLVAGVVAILLAFLLGISVARPIRRLVEATRRISTGSYDVAIEPRRRDELGELERAIVEMAGRLREGEEHERQFLMRVSHELRTPVTAIRSNVDALADGLYEEEDERQAAYAVVGEEADRLARLIGDLLDLAKIEARAFALDLHPVELAPLLQHAAQAALPRAQEREIDLRVAVDTAPVAVVDGDRLLQVVGNLLGNAIRWTPEGGSVVLGAGLHRGRARIIVEDSGPGVPPERRARIFDPLYSEDRAGTGLGLAIANELVHAMGGRIAVGESVLGGAAFAVDLPLRPARVPERAGASR